MTAEAAFRAAASASFEVSANVTRGAPKRAIQINLGAAAVVIDKRDRPQPAHRIDRRQSTPPGARLI
jgi:hypothetical protein